MKVLVKTISRAMAIAAILDLLLSPMMVGEAMATVTVYTCGAQPGASTSPVSCTSPAVMSSCNTSFTGGGTTYYYCVSPEMSDYLAMAFIVVTGGMIYYFRRRRLASA